MTLFAEIIPVQRIENLPASFFTQNHAQIFQNFQVMGNCRLRQRKIRRDVGSPAWSFFQLLDYFCPGIVAD